MLGRGAAPAGTMPAAPLRHLCGHRGSVHPTGPSAQRGRRSAWLTAGFPGPRRTPAAESAPSLLVLLTRRNRATPDPEDDRSGRGWGVTQPSVLYGERSLVGDRGCEGLPWEARGGTRGHGDWAVASSAGP